MSIELDGCGVKFKGVKKLVRLSKTVFSEIHIKKLDLDNLYFECKSFKSAC